MARLYANENFPLPVVIELRQLGHDVLTVQETGKGGQAVPDEAILEFATQENRAVLTLNRKHFVRLHEVVRNHAGIIVCSLDPDFRGQAFRVQAEIASAAALAGRLIRINRPGPTEVS